MTWQEWATLGLFALAVAVPSVATLWKEWKENKR